jgi:hypothetical protein
MTCTVIEFGSDPADVPYTVPAAPSGEAWAITSWSARGGTSDGTAALELWRPTSTVGQFQLVSISPFATIPAGAVPSATVDIPVQPGDVLGLKSDATGNVPLSYIAGGVNDVTVLVTGDPAPGDTVGGAGATWGSGAGNFSRINLSATLSTRALSPPAVTPPVTTPVTKKKCKKKKKRHASTAKKKKKCKKKRKK